MEVGSHPPSIYFLHLVKLSPRPDKASLLYALSFHVFQSFKVLILVVRPFLDILVSFLNILLQFVEFLVQLMHLGLLCLGLCEKRVIR